MQPSLTGKLPPCFAHWGLLQSNETHSLQTYLEPYDKHKTLSNFQHRFRAMSSCEAQLLITIDMTQHDIGILDLSKAFDTVPHKHFLNKLDQYEVNKKYNHGSNVFLPNTANVSLLKGIASSSIHVDSGVPKGQELGPLLFLTHINDLPDKVTSTVRLFADACLLYCNI